MIASDVLLELYKCPAEPERWSSVLDSVCRKLDVKSAVVQRFIRSGDSLVQTWNVRDSASERDAELHDRLVNNAANPRLNLQLVREPKPGRAARDSDRFASNCPHLAALRLRLRSAGLGDSIGVGSRGRGDETIAFVLHRHYGDTRPFSEHDERLLIELLPHIENALDLARRLERRDRVAGPLEEVAAKLPVGIVLCDDQGTVCWANDMAEEILLRSSHVQVRAGQLRVTPGQPGHGLRTLLEHGKRSEPGLTAASLVLGSGEDDELHIARLPITSDRQEIALVISEPRRKPRPSVEAVSRLLSVTLAEARVAAALSAGQTLKEFAHRRGISEGSARNQLKQVLAKTGTRRQAELIRHLGASAIFQLNS